MLGDQPPADDGDEQDAGDGDGDADRREIEHAEGRVGVVRPDRRDDDVGRRPDQRDQTAQQRSEGQRHQQLARIAARLARDLDNDGHQQGECADVVHESGERGHQGRDRADLQRRAELRLGKPLGDEADDA